MLAFAYAECGLTVDEFFRLSLYEWSLEIYKVRKRSEREKEIWESNAVFVRKIIAAVLNSAGKSYEREILETEIVQLSFDKKQTEGVTEPLTQKGMKNRLGTKFKKNG